MPLCNSQSAAMCDQQNIFEVLGANQSLKLKCVVL